MGHTYMDIWQIQVDVLFPSVDSLIVGGVDDERLWTKPVLLSPKGHSWLNPCWLVLEL